MDKPKDVHTKSNIKIQLEVKFSFSGENFETPHLSEVVDLLFCLGEPKIFIRVFPRSFRLLHSELFQQEVSHEVSVLQICLKIL